MKTLGRPFLSLRIVCLVISAAMLIQSRSAFAQCCGLPVKIETMSVSTNSVKTGFQGNVLDNPPHFDLIQTYASSESGQGASLVTTQTSTWALSPPLTADYDIW